MASARMKEAPRNALVCALCVSSACICALSPRTRAQDVGPEAIRVESNEVVVPVLVFDKNRLDEIHRMDFVTFDREAFAKNSHLLDDLGVAGLSANDFQIFEDGKEQQIQRVAPERQAPQTLMIRTIRGSNPDAALDTEAGQVVHFHWPGYLVAYTPPPSSEGSCHQVMVKVDRADSVVYARPEYCNVPHAVNDTLKGTQFGNQMAADLDSGKPGSIKLSLMVFPMFGDAGDTYRTDVIVESPTKPRWVSDCTKLPKIGALGILYTSDDAIAARFSGLVFGDLSNRNESQPRFFPVPPSGDKSCRVSDTGHYATRLDLAPGRYVLRVVLRDGKKFGRAEIPITLDRYSNQDLAVSDVMVANKYRQTPDESGESVSLSAGAYVPLATRGFEVLPAPDPRFKKGEALKFYFEVYRREQRAAAAEIVETHLRIVDAKTGQVVKRLRPVDAAPYTKPGDPVIPIGGGIDISELPSGLYRLEVQATDSAGNSTPWRTTNFTIER